MGITRSIGNQLYPLLIVLVLFLFTIIQCLEQDQYKYLIQQQQQQSQDDQLGWEEEYHIESLFIKWMSDNNRYYSNEEFRKRYNIFKNNYYYVKDWNDSVDNSIVSSPSNDMLSSSLSRKTILSLNGFADLTNKEYIDLYRLQRQPLLHHRSSLRTFSPSSPSSYSSSSSSSKNIVFIDGSSRSFQLYSSGIYYDKSCSSDPKDAQFILYLLDENTVNTSPSSPSSHLQSSSSSSPTSASASASITTTTTTTSAASSSSPSSSSSSSQSHSSASSLPIGSGESSITSGASSGSATGSGSASSSASGSQTGWFSGKSSLSTTSYSTGGNTGSEGTSTSSASGSSSGYSGSATSGLTGSYSGTLSSTGGNSTSSSTSSSQTSGGGNGHGGDKLDFIVLNSNNSDRKLLQLQDHMTDTIEELDNKDYYYMLKGSFVNRMTQVDDSNGWGMNHGGGRGIIYLSKQIQLFQLIYTDDTV